MKRVLVTGSNGFIGKNLVERLRRCKDVEIKTFDIKDDVDRLREHLKNADIIFHLAGVNRPEKIKEFETGNIELTQAIVDILEKVERVIPVVFPSSIQALLDNPYGISKRKAEDILIEYSKKNDANIYIYRFPNVFGKWCRPNYNSVVATFCHNIAHGRNITISDINNEINLIYIDDVVNEFVKILLDKDADKNKYYYDVKQTFRITLGELASKLYEISDIRKTLVVPDLADKLMKCLHATYLSYLDKNDFSYKLDFKRDERGGLAELIKSKYFGQIFVSTSHKGIIRGSHYHNTKIEKFCVLKGKAVVKFRHILEDEILSYYVSGDNFEVVDIPPGYTHSIENLGDSEIIVLFWANQIFNPEKPDTYHCEV